MLKLCGMVSKKITSSQKSCPPITLKCGRLLTVANTAVITTKHIDFGHVFAEPTYPSHDADGYPVEGIDDVPGSANAKQSQSLLPELHCQQHVLNYAKFTAVIAASITLKQYLKDQKILPTSA